MLRSMFSGVSGLRTHQAMMDVVGNNIANVNTPGFKASMATFQEALTQVMRAAAGSSGSDGRGGINPIQVGLGSKLASVDTIFTQGASQVTGRNTDLAIQGDGFFVLEQGTERFYSRAGAFGFDDAGNLVSSGGLHVLGWMADPTGAVDTNGAIAPIALPVGQVISPEATGWVGVGGNLPSDAATGAVLITSLTVYDSLGAAHQLQVEFTKTGDNAWSAAASVDGSAGTITPSSLTFNPDGTLLSPDPSVLGFAGVTPSGADPLAFDIDLGGLTPIVQYGGAATLAAYSQDGKAIGFLRGFSIGDDGSITGQFSNGETKRLGILATATFNNPSGLAAVGNSNFAASLNSGEPLVGTPGSGNRGLISAGTLEMSNVDLAREFTNLIVAQRGFQANSRIITASDELLSDLVNMRR